MPNFWMGLGGVFFLLAGVFAFRKEIAAARGWDKLIVLAPVLFGASLAAFAPEHFRGPDFVKNSVPSWMPGHAFWAYFVGCALVAAAASLTFRFLERLSATLLGVMFTLFVLMIYLPSLLRHPDNRFAWALLFRDFSFAAGGWALAGLHSRASSPRAAKAMILVARLIIGSAGVAFGIIHFRHPQFAPGVPLQKMMPGWIPLPEAWAYAAGAIFLGAGVCLIVNFKSRIAAASIGTMMTVLAICPYLVLLILAQGPNPVNEGINYVADTLLYAGSALALALALRY